MIPLNRPEWNTILDEGKGKADEQEQAQLGPDYWGAEAGGSGSISGGYGSGPRRFQAHDLRLEVEVRRHGGERGAGGEQQAPNRLMSIIIGSYNCRVGCRGEIGLFR